MNAAVRWSRVVCVCALWVCAVGLYGCDLFHGSGDTIERTTKLPALQADSESIQLEIVFLERPAGDRLLGDTLWNQLDENLSLLESDEQRDLAKNGFRVGVSGNHPPAALQKLLELKAGLETIDAVVPENSAAKLTGKRVYVRSGEAAQIQLNDVAYPELKAQIFPSYSSQQGDWKTYKSARCLYRLSVHRVQPGWARLDFVPEIHYGQEMLRPQAGDSQWEMLSTPLIERLFKQRFSVTLNTGDMALVTCRENSPDSLGQRMFCGPAGADELQRVLLIRLAHTGQGSSPYTAQR